MIAFGDEERWLKEDPKHLAVSDFADESGQKRASTQLPGSDVIYALNALFEEHPKASLGDDGQIKLPIEELPLLLQPFFPRIEDLTRVIALLADSNRGPRTRVCASDFLVALDLSFGSASTRTNGNCHTTHDLDDDTPSRGAYTKVLRHCEDLDRRLDDVVVRLDALDLEDLPAMERRVAYASKEIRNLNHRYTRVEGELSQTSRQVVDVSRDQDLLQTQLKNFNSSLLNLRKMQVSLPTGQTHMESAQAGGVRFLSRDLANSRNVALPKNPDALEVFTKCIFNVGEADEDEEEDTSLANPTSCTPWDHLPAPVFEEIYQDVEDDHLQTLGSAEVYEDIAIQAEDTYYAIPTLRTSLDPILAANDDKLDAELTDPDETRSVMVKTFKLGCTSGYAFRKSDYYSRYYDYNSQYSDYAFRKPDYAVDTLTMISESLTIIPDTLTMLFESLTIIPDTLTIIPDTLTIIPDTLTIIPDTLTIIPDTLTIIPDTLTIIPDTLTMIMETLPMITVLETLTMLSESLTMLLTMLPESLTMIPDTLPMLSESLTVLPESLTIIPNTQTIIPDAQTIIPDTLTMLSESLTIIPDTLTMLPKSLTMLPENLTMLLIL
ncbi:hypothetical protein P692DRAFT_20877007 [Suillus brevipes Sb2]|nr:hypothetical protein P692DRAFT_20877007 [Suillus brevipes Sb2]